MYAISCAHLGIGLRTFDLAGGVAQPTALRQTWMYLPIVNVRQLGHDPVCLLIYVHDNSIFCRMLWSYGAVGCCGVGGLRYSSFLPSCSWVMLVSVALLELQLFLTTLGFVAAAISIAVCDVKTVDFSPTFSDESSSTVGFYAGDTIVWALSLGTNVWATVMVAYKAWYVFIYFNISVSPLL